MSQGLSGFVIGRVLMGVVSLMLVACVTVPRKDLLLTSAPGEGGAASSTQRDVNALDTGALRVLSWNIHKATQADLPRDLERYAAVNDVLLLQEAVLSAPVREALVRQGFGWQMVRAFAVSGRERGVVVAARVPAVDGQALCSYEPLFPIPKSAIVTHYRLAGRRESLAVANLHGINFSLGLGRFREQIGAVASELSRHHGPIIFGGDFNTWSQRRHAVLDEVAMQLGLVEVALVPDDRRLAFGQHLDHLFLRGFSVVSAGSPKAKSSDHSPIMVKLKWESVSR